MSTVKVYGIKNCDTMKKAFKWLENNNVPYDFHDYKKDGVDTAILKKAIAHFGWDTVINKRGTTWRQLPDHMKNSMDATIALEAAVANPSLIKRPLLVKGDEKLLGFNEGDYQETVL